MRHSHTSSLTDRFELLERLDSGGLSRVYRAVAKSGREILAVKVLNPIGSDRSNEEWPRRVRRFEREVRILKQLSHCKQVVRFVDADLECRSPWIAMEYIFGSLLRAVIDDTPGDMRLGRFLLVADELCAGLAAIHQAGVIHRDLSPDNIVMVKNKQGGISIKLLDFGIGKPIAEEEQPVTQMPTLMGKPPYLSPEQTRGGKLGVESDIYSLGVVLYETLTGSRPIAVRSFAESARIRREEPKALATFPASQRIPEEFRTLIMSCLAKQPTSRPTLERLSQCIAELRGRHESGETIADDFSDWEISRLSLSVEEPKTLVSDKAEIAGYRVESLIESNKLSTEVWRAEDLANGREVALKVVIGSEAHKSRFLKASALAEKIRSSQTLPCLAHGLWEDKAYAVYELINGSSLDQVLASEEVMTSGQILQVGQGILDALVEIKNMDAGRNHGFLRPSAVLLDEFDVVKLRNFSWGPEPKDLDPAQADVVAARWQAPERLLGCEPSDATDVYSFGCLLFAMIVGDSPFDGPDMAQCFHHWNSRPSSPLERRPDFRPPILADLAMDCLSKDADRRPDDVIELRERFLDCFSHEVIEEKPPPALPPATETPVKSRRWINRFLGRENG